MKTRTALVAATLGSAVLSTTTAHAQNFWVARANGLSYAGNVGIGHNSNPTVNLDIRTNDLQGASILSSATSGRTIGILSRNLSTRGTAIQGINRSRFGSNYGVVGTAISGRGTGVMGVGRRGIGVHGKTQSGVAIMGRVTSNNSSAFSGMFLGGPVYFEQNVGIGTVLPVVPLDIDGHARMTTGSRLFLGGTESIGSNNFDQIFIERRDDRGVNNSDVVLHIGEDPNTIDSITDRFIIEAASTEIFRFETNGLAWIRGTPAWSQLSDRRLKHDINDLDGSLEKLMGLRGVTFYYNDGTGVGTSEGERTGFIAQEVEELFPEWVSETDEGYKGLTISGFEALTVESLRELRAEKDAQIDELKTQNAELADRLAALEAAMAELNSEN